MSDELWVVRAGEKARFADEFFDASYVAIGFTEWVPDDLTGTDEQTLRSRVTSAAERSYANQVIYFVLRMQVGDLVIMPRLTTKYRDYLVGRVTGLYQHVNGAPESGPHRRSIEWLGRFEKNDLSQTAVNTMGAFSTVFRPSNVEAELRGVLTSLKPVFEEIGGERSTRHRVSEATASPAPVAVAPVAGPLPRAQLDIELDADGRARILCGHPALVMEQTPRHVDPSKDWGGVPGVYVLTGTELQTSSQRTGKERTLTLTSIVKPWAYVGLSEDFLGRIGSHRQTKPEWRRALLVRSAAQPFTSDDIKYLELKVHSVLADTDEVVLGQTTPRGNLSAQPRNPVHLDACAETVVAVLRLTGTLI